MGVVDTVWRWGRFAALSLAVILVAAACSGGGGGPERNTAGEVVSAGDESVFELRVGDCIDAGDSVPEQIEELEVVECSAAHTHEVFFEFEYQPDEEDDPDLYPGPAKLHGQAEVECLNPFESYVGVNYFDATAGSLFVTNLVPSLQSWNSEDEDRAILCLVGTPGRSVGSAEGSEGVVIPAPTESPQDSSS